MIRNNHDTKVFNNLRGGDGTVIMEHWMSPDELLGHGRIFSRAIIKPKSSIGWHQHVGEMEAYYILKGEGIFVDNDGTRNKVVPGDLTLINVDESHAIENPSETDDLEIVCLVLYKAAQ